MRPSDSSTLLEEAFTSLLQLNWQRDGQPSPMLPWHPEEQLCQNGYCCIGWGLGQPPGTVFGKGVFAVLLQVTVGHSTMTPWVSSILYPLLSGPRTKEVCVGLLAMQGSIGFSSRVHCPLDSPLRPDPLFSLHSLHPFPPFQKDLLPSGGDMCPLLLHHQVFLVLRPSADLHNFSTGDTFVLLAGMCNSTPATLRAGGTGAYCWYWAPQDCVVSYSKRYQSVNELSY